jgi:GTP-binding protein
VIVGNKFDLISSTEEEVKEYLRKRLSFLDYAPIVLTVATEGKGVRELLDNVLSVYQDYCKQHKTSFINRCVEKVLSEKAPPGRIKVYYAFQEGTKPPTFCAIHQ